MPAKKYAQREAARPADVEHVEVNRLLIDHVSYQRPYKPRAEMMGPLWDDVKAGVLIVNRRASGTLYILDGQHRWEEMKTQGRKFAPCLIYNGLSIKEEAEAFWKCNADRSRVRNDILFHARITAEDPVALDIEDAILTAGFHRTSHVNDRHGIAALSAVERIYQWGKRPLLDDVFTILNGVWREDPRSHSGVAMQGIGFFLHRYREETNFDHQRMLDILAETPVIALIRQQREILENSMAANTDTHAVAFAKAIREFYNKRIGAARKLKPINLTKGKS